MANDSTSPSGGSKIGDAVIRFIGDLSDVNAKTERLQGELNQVGNAGVGAASKVNQGFQNSGRIIDSLGLGLGRLAPKVQGAGAAADGAARKFQQWLSGVSVSASEAEAKLSGLGRAASRGIPSGGGRGGMGGLLGGGCGSASGGVGGVLANVGRGMMASSGGMVGMAAYGGVAGVTMA